MFMVTIGELFGTFILDEISFYSSFIFNCLQLRKHFFPEYFFPWVHLCAYFFNQKKKKETKIESHGDRF